MSHLHLTRKPEDIKIVYVEQFGGWFSFRSKDWLKMLKKMNNESVIFSDYGKELKNKPNLSIPINKKFIVYKMPCDWSKEEYEEVNKFWGVNVK